MLEDDLPTPRTPVFSGERASIGEFRARPGDDIFRDSGPIRAHLLVFPRTAVRVTFAGARGFVADPTCVVLYNRRQEYRREAISPLGDRCEWFSFHTDDLVAAIAPFDPRVVDRWTQPFTAAHAPCDPSTYLFQRRLYERARRGDPRDGSVLEEGAMELLARVVGVQAGRRAEIGASNLAIVEALKASLARSFTAPSSLATLAREVGVSVFHLCRVFRRATGRTIHSHLHLLRLHHALERILGGERNLSALALELGYASHSHFTFAFRRAYGVPPSVVRARGPRATAPSPMGR